MNSDYGSLPAFKNAGCTTIEPRILTETLKTARRTNVAMLEESIGWSYNALLSGFMVLAKDDCWLVIIKAIFEHGPMVAFLDVRGFGRACEVAAEMADSRSLVWHRDKKPNWARKKKRHDVYGASARGGGG